MTASLLPRSPFSSSSSSSDDDIELESLLLPAQALSQTKGKAKKNRKRSNKPSADSDLSDDDINTSAAPATEHEIAQPEIVLPALEKIPEGNEIKSFGSVVSIIENVVVLKAEGEKKVLDEGCLCCWADGTVIGTVSLLISLGCVSLQLIRGSTDIRSLRLRHPTFLLLTIPNCLSPFCRSLYYREVSLLQSLHGILRFHPAVEGAKRK